MKIAALIIGIDGWEQYTDPLVKSIHRHEPDCEVFVIDNASKQAYPDMPWVNRTGRLCYSAAINRAHEIANTKTWWGPPTGGYDWYIVLSNDVLCTGPFSHMLKKLHDVVAGPLLMTNQGWSYIEGWCVCIPSNVWATVGGWDEQFQVSSWEDVDFSVSAVEKGFSLEHMPDLPFVHLDQRQRFGIVPNYWESEVHNVRYFAEKHGAK